MTKNKSDFKLPRVLIKVFDEKVYCFINLNEKEVTQVDENGDKKKYFEYDYNEFVDLKENLSLEDIEQYPENYLEYTVDNRTIEQKINSNSISISELEQCILDMSEIIYQ